MCCRCISSIDGRAQVADFEDVSLLVDLSPCKSFASIFQIMTDSRLTRMLSGFKSAWIMLHFRICANAKKV